MPPCSRVSGGRSPSAKRSRKPQEPTKRRKSRKDRPPIITYDAYRAPLTRLADGCYAVTRTKIRDFFSPKTQPLRGGLPEIMRPLRAAVPTRGR